METYENIPNDVLGEILLKLPVYSLLRFRWTCKYWFDLITRDNDFTKMHFIHSTSDDQIINKTLVLMSDGKVLYSRKYMDMFQTSSSSSKPAATFMVCMNHPFGRGIEILGSCNGLIYLRSIVRNNSNNYFLWNPSTTEFKKLPDCVKPYKEYHKCSTIRGFGYDRFKDDYKVIEIEYLDLDVLITSRINIYTLGSNSWSTKIETNPILLNADMYMLDRTVLKIKILGSKAGVLLNGALHWMMVSPLGSRLAILCFDVVKEEHREIQLSEINYEMWDTSRLEVLNGCLCIFLANFHYKNAELWMMKDYDMKESWIKLFTIDVESLVKEISQGKGRCFANLELLKYSHCGDGGILMLCDRDYLITYYLMNNKATIENTRMKVGFVKQSYIDSMISVKSGMYLSTGAGLQEEEVDSKFSDYNFLVLSRKRQREESIRGFQG